MEEKKMKKKNLVTMLASLSLLAVVGVGSTLAYLSDATDVVTNTFTVGNVDITLDETDITKTDGTRTETGNAYTNIQCGDVLTKDPIVHVAEDSSECYIFVKVEGLDELLATEGLDVDGNTVKAFALDSNAFKDWVKVAEADGSAISQTTGKNGIYRYKETLGAEESTSAVFNSITFNSALTEYEDGEVPEISSIEITAYAIQSENLSVSDAFTSLTGYFEK